MQKINCLTCGKALTDKQISKAVQQHRDPQYCSMECVWEREKKYNYDHTFLNEMTPFAAYFWGLFITDGHFSRDSPRIYIGLVDSQLINELAFFTSYCNPINPHIRKNKPTAKPFYVISFAGDVVKAIASQGYAPGIKTGREFIPSCITDELFPHFLRGVIDGDGWWTIHTQEYKYVHCGVCCSNESFLIDIWDRLERLGIVKQGNLHRSTYKRINALYDLQFGHEDSQRIGDFIYKDAEIKLERKYEIYKFGMGRVLLQKQRGLVCLIEGCGKDTIAKQLCKFHYDQQCHRRYYEEHKDEIDEKNRLWKLAHRDQINERRRDVYADDPEKYRQISRDWRRANPEKVKEVKQAYLSKLKNNEPLQQRTYTNLQHGYSTEYIYQDTQESAYFWGFMLGGAVLKLDKRIEISSKKKNIIDCLAKVTAYTNKISESMRGGEIDYYYISFGGDIAKTFSPFLERKDTINIPEHIKDNVSHFIRGYFDAKGGFSHDSRSGLKLTSQVSAVNKDLLLKFRDIFNAVEIKGGALIEVKGNFRLSFSHADSVKLGEYLYKDSIIHCLETFEKWSTKKDFKREKKQKPKCLVEGCQKESVSKGFCKTHHGKMLKYNMTPEQFLEFKKNRKV